MSSSSLANDLTKGFHIDKCKNCEPDLEYMTVNDGSFVYKFLPAIKNYDKVSEKHLAKIF